MEDFRAKNGMAADEWYRLSLNEARQDQVGFFAVVLAGRDWFGLSGSDLESFVRRYIVALVTGGAVPILGNEGSPGWSPTHEYGTSPEEIADSLIRKWKAA